MSENKEGESHKIITAAIDSLTNKTMFILRVPVRKQVKRKWWQKKRPIETERIYEIKQSVTLNQLRIAAKALTLPKKMFSEANLLFPELIAHQPTMLYIIAAAIENDPDKEPDSELINFLGRNIDGDDIISVLMASLQSLNMQSFFDSIVLMNGLVEIISPEETSPADGSELIASHTE